MENRIYDGFVDTLYSYNEEYEMLLESPEARDVEVKETSEKSPRASLSESIKPMIEVAESVMLSVNEAFVDKCGGTKKIVNMEDQIKHWEKQIRGACEQIVTTVETKGFIIDKTKCSPRAFKKIKNSSSRDLSVIDLCASIIVFYNSLH